ncbi:MAG: hypothetical protein MI674_05165 [Cytophagales bacterium]|nr:hypothetical protein [Cytophagales bacterium]
MTQKEHIKELEKRLKNTSNLAEVGNYFLDHLGEKQSFIKQSTPIETHPLLKAVVEKCGESLFKKKCVVNMFLSKVKDADFIHGFCAIDNRSAVLLYFEKSDIGLLVIPPLDLKSNMDFFRFSTFVTKQPLSGISGSI